MATKAYEDAVEFAVVIAREFPSASAAQVSELLQLSRRHGRLQEQACNEQVKEGHDAACEQKIRDLCVSIGCGVVFGGDPRGYTVKLILPSGRSNHWGGNSWGVPQ